MRLWLWLCSSFPATLFPRKTLFDHVNVFSFSFFFLLLFLLYLVTYLGFWKGKNKHPKSPCNVAVDVSPLLPSFWFCFFFSPAPCHRCYFFLFDFFFACLGTSLFWVSNFLFLPHYSLITSTRPHLVAYVTHTHLFLYLLIIVTHYCFTYETTGKSKWRLIRLLLNKIKIRVVAFCCVLFLLSAKNYNVILSHLI